MVHIQLIFVFVGMNFLKIFSWVIILVNLFKIMMVKKKLCLALSKCYEWKCEMMYVDEIMENYQWYKRVLSHAICLWDDFNKIMNGTKVP